MQGSSSKRILDKFNSLFFEALRNIRRGFGYKAVRAFEVLKPKFSPSVRVFAVFAVVFFAAVPPIMGFGHSSPPKAGDQHKAVAVHLRHTRNTNGNGVQAFAIGYPDSELTKASALATMVSAQVEQHPTLTSLMSSYDTVNALPVNDLIVGMHPISVKVTSYCLSGTTALNTHVALGTVAVDPSVIPLMSYVYVPDYGWSVAVDTGSGIQGDHVDIWLPWTNGCSASTNWGIRYMTVYVAPTILGPLPRDLRDIIQEAQQNGW